VHVKSFHDLTRDLTGSYAGWITGLDRDWLTEFLQREYLLTEKPAPTIIEIGVFMGSTTNLLCLASGGRVIAIDDWSGGPHDDFATLRDGFIDHTTASGFYPDRICIVDGSSREVGAIWRETVNLVYVDGDHSYEGCLIDLQNFAPWASDFMLVDDYDIDDVKRAVSTWIISSGWRPIRIPTGGSGLDHNKLFAAERIK
jgi:cephalosporin hydroxylase